jgi:hypothetical protein
MSRTNPATRLGTKIAAGRATIDEICEFLFSLLPDAVLAVNERFSPRQLAKRERVLEQLPTAKRQLSSYRTRIGTTLEYALSTEMDQAIEATFKHDLRLTFAVAHEYPDFYIRDAVLEQRVRIEMKAVDADFDEQAARFEVLKGLIDGEKDVVMLIGWEWQSGKLPNGTQFEYPQIFSFVIVPAAELAGERDRSVELRGGRVETDRILVPSKKRPGELTPDPHNAGKILRLVHQTRRAEPFKLSEHIQRYLQFVTNVEGRVKQPSSRRERKGGKSL